MRRKLSCREGPWEWNNDFSRMLSPSLAEQKQKSEDREVDEMIPEASLLGAETRMEKGRKGFWTGRMKIASTPAKSPTHPRVEEKHFRIKMLSSQPT